MPDLGHQKYFQWIVYRPRTNCKGYFPFNKTHRPNIINLLWLTILVMSVPSVFWKSQLAYWMVGMSHSQEMWWFSGLASIHHPSTGLLNPHNMKVARPGHNHKGQRPPWRSRVIHWLLLKHPSKEEGKCITSQTTFERANIYHSLCQYSLKIPRQERVERGISPLVFLSHLENSNRCILKSWKAWQSNI